MLRIELPKDRFIVSEELDLTVRVTNEGAAPVQIQNPFQRGATQPIYTVQGPQYPNGRAFSFSTASRSPDGPPPPAPEMISLAPGEILEESVPLHAWCPLREPGRYQLRAEFTDGETTGGSNALVFTVERPAVRSASAGVDAGVRGGPVWVSWLQGEGPDPRLLMRSFFQEGRADLGEFDEPDVSSVLAIGAGADEMLSPWCWHDRRSGLFSWCAWREGDKLFALSGMTPRPVAIDPGRPIQQLLRPALMDSAGNLDVFAIDGNGEGIILARWASPAASGDAPPPGKVLWRWKSGEAIVAGRTALAPARGGFERHLALVAQGSDGLLLIHRDAGDGGTSGTASEVAVSGASALSGSTPGLALDPDGRWRLAVVHQAASPAGRLALTEAVFPGSASAVRSGSGTESPALRTELLPELPAPPRAAAVSFGVAGGWPRLDLVVVLEDGSIAASTNRSAWKIVRPDAPPVLPLEVLSLAQSSYVLCAEPSVGPRFAAL